MSELDFSGKWRVVNPDLTVTVEKVAGENLSPGKQVWYAYSGRVHRVHGKKETEASWDENGDGYLNGTRCPDIDLMERIRENG